MPPDLKIHYNPREMTITSTVPVGQHKYDPSIVGKNNESYKEGKAFTKRIKQYIF